MGDKSAIEWTDATWNPVRGCTKISPGCKHCYAETFAERWRGIPGHPYEHGFDLRLVPEALELPMRWSKPRRIFVNSMSDLFHEGVTDLYVAKVLATISESPQHTFQVLTKRADRMRRFFSEVLDFSPPINLWLGVSVEGQVWLDERLPELAQIDSSTKFLSVEPLLGPIDLCLGEYSPGAGRPDWVIVGGESGPGARPVDPDWVRSLRDQCVEFGVPFFFKQWGGQNKKAAGRVLDGRTWDEFPASPT